MTPTETSIVPTCVVVIGASAGGVQALSELFANLPAELDAAFMVVLHISPSVPSQLANVLGRATAMAVSTAVDGEPVQRGHVYVAAADRHLLVEGATVRVTKGPRESRSRPAVDALFRSAAVAFGPMAIGVVLSGALDDGTAGLWAIKDRGGRALVQDPATAEFDSMPQSALEHVAVDGSLTLPALSRQIASYVEQAKLVAMDKLTSPHSESMQIENIVALEGNGFEAGVMSLGRLSPLACPDCHGTLVEIQEGTILRYRCHTGHAFSLKTLMLEIDESIDLGLWKTLRAVEERIIILEKLRVIACDTKNDNAAIEYNEMKIKSTSRALSIRALLMGANI